MGINSRSNTSFVLQHCHRLQQALVIQLYSSLKFFLCSYKNWFLPSAKKLRLFSYSAATNLPNCCKNCKEKNFFVHFENFGVRIHKQSLWGVFAWGRWWWKILIVKAQKLTIFTMLEYHQKYEKYVLFLQLYDKIG